MKSLIPVKQGALSAAQFGKLADLPPEREWLANITNEKPRRAYKLDAGEFQIFSGCEGRKNSERSRGCM
jgi:hypothetical protein